MATARPTDFRPLFFGLVVGAILALWISGWFAAQFASKTSAYKVAWGVGSQGHAADCALFGVEIGEDSYALANASAASVPTTGSLVSGDFSSLGSRSVKNESTGQAFVVEVVFLTDNYAGIVNESYRRQCNE
jgi:hypothetical protein